MRGNVVAVDDGRERGRADCRLRREKLLPWQVFDSIESRRRKPKLCDEALRYLRPKVFGRLRFVVIVIRIIGHVFAVDCDNRYDVDDIRGLDFGDVYFRVILNLDLYIIFIS